MLKKATEIWTSKLPFLNEKEAQELATTISFFLVEKCKILPENV